MTYVDGFVVPVPNAKKDEYLAMAQLAADVFIDCGALEVVENWGDNVPKGTVTDFHRSVLATDTETVVLSWIVWPSKEARDRGNAKAMEDPRFAGMTPGDVFDGKRMIFSGFEPLLRRTADE